MWRPMFLLRSFLAGAALVGVVLGVLWLAGGVPRKPETPQLMAVLVVAGGIAGAWLAATMRSARQQLTRYELGADELEIASAMSAGRFDECGRLSVVAADRAEAALGPSPRVVELQLRAAFWEGVAAKSSEVGRARTERALAMARSLPPSAKPELARALAAVAGVHRAAGRLEASELHWRAALEVLETMAATREQVHALGQLTQLADAGGRPDEGDALYLRAYTIDGSLPPADRDPFIVTNHIARLMRTRPTEALALARTVVALRLGSKDVTSARALLARARYAAGDVDGAVREAEALVRETPAPDQGYAVNQLVELLHEAGRHAEAEPLLRQWLAQAEAERAQGDHGFDPTLAVRWKLGRTLLALGRPEEGRPLVQAVLTAYEAMADEPWVREERARLSALLVT